MYILIIRAQWPQLSHRVSSPLLFSGGFCSMGISTIGGSVVSIWLWLVIISLMIMTLGKVVLVKCIIPFLASLGSVSSCHDLQSHFPSSHVASCAFLGVPWSNGWLKDMYHQSRLNWKRREGSKKYLSLTYTGHQLYPCEKMCLLRGP